MRYCLFALLLSLVSCGDSSKTNNPISEDPYLDNNVIRYTEANDNVHDSTIISTKYFPTSVQQDSAILTISKEDRKVSDSIDHVINKAGVVSEKLVDNKILPKAKSKGRFLFDEMSYNFGFIEVGEQVDHVFAFQNIGQSEINISNVIASCGCTRPVYPFIPIPPGEKGEILVRFNSEGRLGSQEATITVFSDAAEKELELGLKGVVRSNIETINTLQDSL